MKNTEREKKCVLCGEKFKDWGNNPAPLKNVGKCCKACNFLKVIPARLITDNLQGQLHKLNVQIKQLKKENKQLKRDNPVAQLPTWYKKFNR